MASWILTFCRHPPWALVVGWPRSRGPHHRPMKRHFLRKASCAIPVEGAVCGSLTPRCPRALGVVAGARVHRRHQPLVGLRRATRPARPLSVRTARKQAARPAATQHHTRPGPAWRGVELCLGTAPRSPLPPTLSDRPTPAGRGARLRGSLSSAPWDDECPESGPHVPVGHPGCSFQDVPKQRVVTGSHV